MELDEADEMVRPKLTNGAEVHAVLTRSRKWTSKFKGCHNPLNPNTNPESSLLNPTCHDTRSCRRIYTRSSAVLICLVVLEVDLWVHHRQTTRTAQVTAPGSSRGHLYSKMVQGGYRTVNALRWKLRNRVLISSPI